MRNFRQRWSKSIVRSLDYDISRLNKRLAKEMKLDDPFYGVREYPFRSITPRGMKREFSPDLVYYSAWRMIICGFYPHMFLQRPFSPSHCLVVNDFLAQMEEKYPVLSFEFRVLTPGEMNVLSKKFGKD